jgi:hypothetical protein
VSPLTYQAAVHAASASQEPGSPDAPRSTGTCGAHTLSAAPGAVANADDQSR